MTSPDPHSVNLLGDPRQAMIEQMVRRTRLVRGVTAFLVLAFLMGIGYYAWFVLHPKTGHQMVLLANGQVYIGNLDSLNSSFAVLTDVHYFQSQVDPKTKEPKSVLLKRRHEIHAPDLMMVNTQHIIAIEPVAPDSSLGRRLAEMKEKE